MLGEARMTWFVDMAAMSDRVILNQESAAKYANQGMKPLPIQKERKRIFTTEFNSSAICIHAYPRINQLH
ncbi:hypothetical protein FRN29_16160 [Vibrio alginolyticus]|nr:hypothetical protein [Vibrio alginolyticus]